MKGCALLFTCFINCVVHCQDKPILVFDIGNQTWDSISNISFDPTILRENTKHHYGCFDSSIEQLASEPPISNVFPESQFTKKERASIELDLNSYPIRTTVKVFQTLDDSLQHLCSGSLISSRHVLTATHCLSLVNTNDLREFDSLIVAPVFDDGRFNDFFPRSYVSKLYFFKDWSIGSEDLAILEIEEPIGLSTGWLGIGFAPTEELADESIFYKFSYPSITNVLFDPNEYNGDTLYYNYGLPDYFTDTRIGHTAATGIEGESGSSLIKIENEVSYVSYGVFSLGVNYTHSRIDNWKYFAIKSIIQDDLIIGNQDLAEEIVVYPNPSTGLVRIKKSREIEITGIILFDSMGRKCLVENDPEACLKMDISGLPNGMYIMDIITPETTISKKVIKSVN